MMEKRVKAAKKKPPKGAVNCFLFFTQFFYPIFNGISNDLFSLNRYAENSISAPRDFSQVNRGSSRSLRYIEMTFYLFFVEESLSIFHLDEILGFLTFRMAVRFYAEIGSRKSASMSFLLGRTM